MELIRGLLNLKRRHCGCVASIGNFDGVHRGHQAVIRQLQRHSKTLSQPAVLITFEPQPQEYFAAADPPPRLITLREKLALLDGLGVDRVLCLRFFRTLAEMSAHAFIESVLVNGLGVKHLVVGDDFRFGHGRVGDFALLERAGRQYGFDVERTETYHLDGERISSTRIRQALQSGDLVRAEQLLGHPYRISGRVAHGDRRGRSWGFPTANIHLNRRKAPLTGIFMVEVDGIDAAPVAGVANLGNRPTLGGTRTLLEVHLLDFDRDIYGRYVEVRFLCKLRDEKRFENLDALKTQIAHDVHQARSYFDSRAV